ncbi:uncharacterized protein LOC126379675 [Pectinophora gossypiella]|uniref:uncharacterized protein LOC126379675 n=1 Tax=Pectinophora gossypiella TaxID=13191 RepID=UPI00214E2C0F|nr:uncharacterized protein LOC126379675 [Pectinophora gossypiella]
MIKRHTKSEQCDTKPKDRGDNVRKEEKMMKFIKVDMETQVNQKNFGDRGDSPGKKTQKTDNKKNDLDVHKSQNIDKLKKRFGLNRNTAEDNFRSERNMKKTIEKMNMDIKPLDIDKRRKLAEKYTFRKAHDYCTLVVRKDNNKTEKGDYKKNFKLPLKSQDLGVPPVRLGDQNIKNLASNTEAEEKSLRIDFGTSPDRKTTKFDRELRHSDRKPIIKTLVSKGDCKVYKAVTFVDKKTKSTPLRITMPSSKTQRGDGSRLIGTETPDSTRSKYKVASTPEKPVTNRKNKIVKRTRKSSPELSVRENAKPPLTEVAKWAPLSVNPHTQPYYEAWVNKTPAAMSRDPEEEKFYLEQQDLLQALQQKAKNKTPSQTTLSLVDEHYTGKITVSRDRKLTSRPFFKLTNPEHF